MYLMRKNILSKIVLFSATLMGMAFLSNNAQAQDVIYKEKTEIDFEAVDVEGQLKKPQGVLSMERVKASFNPLVQLREDFALEMENSVNDIQ